MSMLDYSLFYKPFEFTWAMELVEKHEKMHWGAWEAKLQEDVNQWKLGTISDKEKNHITQILRLFTQTDAQVASNYCDLFIPKFKNNQIRSMLLSFAAREVTHQTAYALLNDTLGFPDSEYSAFQEYEEMKNKIEFMKKNDVSSLTGLGKALAQSVCNEGMSLFSAFTMLLNYQRTGKMKGMCEIIEWSLRDEDTHISGMTRLFREFCIEHPKIVTDRFKASIYEMYIEAVELEDKIIDLAYKMGEVDGLSKDEIKLYIRYLADRRLITLGLKSNWGIKDNPLPWLDWIINGDSFKNFFEGQITDYLTGGLNGDWGW